MELKDCIHVWQSGLSLTKVANITKQSVHEVVRTLKWAGAMQVHTDHENDDYSDYGYLTKHSFKKSQLYLGKPRQTPKAYSAKDATITWQGREITGYSEGTEIKLEEGVDMSRDNVKVETTSEKVKKWLDGEWVGGNKVITGTISNSVSGVNITENPVFNNTTGVTNMTRRATVTVELWDDSKGIESQDSLVYSTDMISSDFDIVVIQQVLLEKNVKKHLDRHNDKRTELVNQDILERTGNEVYLREVKLKDLRWSVKR
jgi:hypothetical protein